MGTFETFDHTADLGLRIWGQDLADLFITAARGLTSVIVANPGSIVAAVTEPIDLEADSIAELLVVWLNELIFRVETKHSVYDSFLISIRPRAAGFAVEGEIAGERLDRSRHVYDHEVKAVTRHGVLVESSTDPKGWNAEVILDI